MNLVKNQGVRWTATAEDGELVTYHGIVTQVKGGYVSFYVPDVGTMTVPTDDGRFEAAEIPTKSQKVVEVVKPTKTKVVVQSISTDKTLKKSEQVRIRIALAKQNNEDEDIVVQWAIDNLGMVRSLARTYVKGNWSRV